jgi:hypothetical protein
MQDWSFPPSDSAESRRNLLGQHDFSYRHGSTMPQGKFNLSWGKLNPPLAEFNPPLAELNPPLAELNPPQAELNPPLAELNPPLAELNPPQGKLNPPWGKFNPPQGRLTMPRGKLTIPQGRLNPPSAWTDFSRHGRIWTRPAAKRTRAIRSAGSSGRSAGLPNGTLSLHGSGIGRS